MWEVMLRCRRAKMCILFPILALVIGASPKKDQMGLTLSSLVALSTFPLDDKYHSCGLESER